MGRQSEAFLFHIPLRRSRIRLVIAETCDRRFRGDSRYRWHSVACAASRHGGICEWGAVAGRLSNTNSGHPGRFGRSREAQQQRTHERAQKPALTPYGDAVLRK